MPRNNQERLGTKDEGQTPPPTQNSESILNFVSPTEFVELPTKGKFYPQNHPLYNVESVEIKHMTAKETDILTSRTLLKKGIAIDRMLQSIIIDKSIQVEDLYVGDKNALVVAARISGFGNNYEASISCTSCGIVSEQSFDLESVNIKESQGDVEFTKNGTFFVELPKTKVKAECRLLTAKDEKELTAKTEKKQKLKLPESPLTDQYKSFLVSLNDVTDRRLVEEFVDLMPAQDSNFLRKQYDKMRPDLDLTYFYECESCEFENHVDIPFSTNFFWPD